MEPLTKDSSILIIGGGTWGCSTALHLARRGYTNVTVLEAHPIPSPISAGNDVNKIMEEGEPSESDTEEQYVWNRMHQITTKYWKEDEVFKSFYHPTGIIL
jgi:sarcosine oxidase/L-pipecolate oxidase